MAGFLSNKWNVVILLIQFSNANIAMDLKHLRLVSAIAQHGGLTAAMDELHLSQPALSQRLTSLEKELGVALFSRVGRRMVPTAAGELALETAREVIDKTRSLETKLKAMAHGERVLRLGAQCYTALHWLPGIMAAFGRKHPRTRLLFVSEATHDVEQALMQGRIDVGIAHSVSEAGRFRRVPLFADELAAIVPIGHRLATRAAIEPEDLAGEVVYLHKSPSQRSGRAADFLARAGRVAASLEQIQWTDPILEFVRAGMGIGIVPTWAVPPRMRTRLHVCRLTAKGMRRDWAALILSAHKTSAMPDTRDLLELLKKAPHAGA